MLEQNYHFQNVTNISKGVEFAGKIQLSRYKMNIMQKTIVLSNSKHALTSLKS